MGFAAGSMVAYSAEEMLALASDELQAVGPMASFGYELDLLRAQHGLAAQGCCFLVVHAPAEVQVERVANLLGSLQPASAQHYGRFLIRDLTEPAPGYVEGAASS